MFIDTHCHLTDNYISGDLNDVISRATAAGVGMMICPTAEPGDIARAIQIAETYDNIFATSTKERAKQISSTVTARIQSLDESFYQLFLMSKIRLL